MHNIKNRKEIYMSKTQVNEIDRNIYDIKNKDDYEFKMQKGLSREIVEQISKRKNEPVSLFTCITETKSVSSLTLSSIS